MCDKPFLGHSLVFLLLDAIDEVEVHNAVSFENRKGQADEVVVRAVALDLQVAPVRQERHVGLVVPLIRCSQLLDQVSFIGRPVR